MVGDFLDIQIAPTENAGSLASPGTLAIEQQFQRDGAERGT